MSYEKETIEKFELDPFYSKCILVNEMPILASEHVRDESLIEAALYIKIINKAPVGGDLSLVISDNTIFPLFLDSLKTGKWRIKKMMRDFYLMTQFGVSYQ